MTANKMIANKIKQQIQLTNDAYFMEVILVMIKNHLRMCFWMPFMKSNLITTSGQRRSYVFASEAAAN